MTENTVCVNNRTPSNILYSKECFLLDCIILEYCLLHYIVIECCVLHYTVIEYCLFDDIIIECCVLHYIMIEHCLLRFVYQKTSHTLNNDTTLCIRFTKHNIAYWIMS